VHTHSHMHGHESIAWSGTPQYRHHASCSLSFLLNLTYCILFCLENPGHDPFQIVNPLKQGDSQLRTTSLDTAARTPVRRGQDTMDAHPPPKLLGPAQSSTHVYAHRHMHVHICITQVHTNIIHLYTQTYMCPDLQVQAHRHICTCTHTQHIAPA
jgi:hypothetical protein